MVPAPSPRLLRGAFYACLGVVAVYLLISAFEPLRLNWGDPWSDANAMTSGKHFDEEGFFKLAFTPRVDIGPVGPDTLVYTHYPPLPDLVNGFLQRISGGEHLAFFRIVALLWSALSLYFFHSYIRRLWGDAIAKVGTVAIATNLLWLQYADTLHHIPLYTMTGFACLAAALRYLDEERGWQLAAVGVAGFFCYLASYDYYFFVPIMLLGTIKWRKQRWLRGRGFKVLLVFGIGGLASIALKNVLAIWAVGVDRWYADLIFQFFERSSSAYARSYREGLAQVIFWRLWRFYSPLFYGCGLVLVIALVDRVRGRTTEISPQPLLVLVAGAPFVHVFSQLIVEQYHPTLLFLPFAALAIAAVVVVCWQQSKIVGAALLAVYIGWQAHQLSLFKKMFLEPSDIAGVQRALAADRHRFLMTNMLVDAPSRYYWNRYAFGILSEPKWLRNHLEKFGADSPLTVVQVKHTSPYAYDKGIYMYFAGGRHWTWISRPDWYRNSWAHEFDQLDKQLDAGLSQLGKVVYESPAIRVRQITLEDIDRVQRERVPRRPVDVIDFDSAASEPYKLDGFSGRIGPDESLKIPGYALLEGRQPARPVFTLHGFDYPETAPMITKSDLVLPLRSDVPALHFKVTMSIPLWLGTQDMTIAINGHPVAHAKLYVFEPPRDIEFDVPREVLAPGELQLVTFAYAYVNRDDAAARLHRIEIRAR